MKRFFALSLPFLFVAAFVFGEVDPLPDASLWEALLGLLQKFTAGNLTILGVGVALVHAGVVLFRTTIGANLAGKWTLAVLYGLNTILATLMGVQSGASILEVLGSAAVMSFLMNGIAELVKNLSPKPA